MRKYQAKRTKVKDLGTPVRPVRLAEVKYLSPHGTDRQTGVLPNMRDALIVEEREREAYIGNTFPTLVAEDDAVNGIIMLATRDPFRNLPIPVGTS